MLVCLGAVLWGTGGLAGSALREATAAPMLVVAALRLLVGGGLLLVVLALVGRVRGLRAPGAPGRVAVTGLLAAVYQSAYFGAVQLTGVAVATVVALGSAPVAVAVATALVRRRVPGLRTVGALALATGGLVLLVLGPGEGAVVAPGGVLLALVAGSAFAAMTLVNRRRRPGPDPLGLTAVAFTVGGLLLAPFAVLVGGWPGEAGATDGWDASAWLLVIYLGIGPTALAYAAYFRGLHGVPPTTATVLALLEPLTAAVGAAVLLGERPGPVALVGGLALVAAVLVLRPASPTMEDGRRRPRALGRSDELPPIGPLPPGAGS
nr:DMT family transporter [Cellulomonas sp. APG4]